LYIVGIALDRRAILRDGRRIGALTIMDDAEAEMRQRIAVIHAQ